MKHAQSDRMLAGLALAGLLLLGTASLSPARALPQCPAASPERISKPTFIVDQLWQRYRSLTPEHRCCARPCEPLVRYAAKVEENAFALNDVARNPRISEAEHDRAHDGANAMLSLRTKLAADFIQCLNETRVRGTGAAAVCGTTTLGLKAAWARWCDAYTERFRRFRNLLVATVGDNVGTWQVQSNWFRIVREGGVDGSSATIVGAPGTKLPPGKSTRPFLDLIYATALPAFPSDASLQNRMYMRFTARAIRLPGPAGTKAIDVSTLLDGPCPGSRQRPAS